MDFQASKNELNRELKRFISLLGQVLPRYVELLQKSELDKSELSELGEIEHYLIGVNSQISEIKEKLEKDLFGHTLDTYYKLKNRVLKGDKQAEEKLKKLQTIFQEELSDGNIVNWN
jgi:hypothetical protein